MQALTAKPLVLANRNLGWLEHGDHTHTPDYMASLLWKYGGLSDMQTTLAPTNHPSLNLLLTPS